MKAVGISGTIELVGGEVHLLKRRFFGKSQGVHVVSIRDLTGVAFTAAGILSNGNIQLVHRHSQQNPGLFDIRELDLDTVLFAKKDQPAFEALRDLLRERMTHPATAQRAISAELESLADLYRAGLLSEDEFLAAKGSVIAINHNM